MMIQPRMNIGKREKQQYIYTHFTGIAFDNKRVYEGSMVITSINLVIDMSQVFV